MVGKSEACNGYCLSITPHRKKEEKLKLGLVRSKGQDTYFIWNLPLYSYDYISKYQNHAYIYYLSTMFESSCIELLYRSWVAIDNPCRARTDVR